MVLNPKTTCHRCPKVGGRIDQLRSRVRTQIEGYHRSTRSSQSILLGRVLEFESTPQDNCKTCQHIRDGLNLSGRSFSSFDSLLITASDEPSFAAEFYLHVQSVVPTEQVLYLISSTKKEKHSIPAASPTDKASHSLNVMRRCLSHCAEFHNNTCGDSGIRPNSSQSIPVLLIDLVNDCLVKSTTATQYGTLSYVWGKDANVLETRRANLDELMQNGALKTGKHSLGLHKTILSSLEFSREMGLRYLWVDRLCIVQDDDEHKATQIRAMGSIFASSYFTIVDADGNDANHSLTWDDNRTRSSHNILDFGGRHVYLGMVQRKPIAQGSKWATRAWTLQEWMFSRRVIVFYEGRLIWKCLQSVWHDDFDEDCKQLYEAVNPQFSDSFEEHRWPNLLNLKTLLESYTQRDLTFPWDSLAAFSGVLEVLRRSFPGGFHFGLPELFFDVALLWQPKTQIVDRISSCERLSLDGHSVELPSWSWVRWQGDLDFESWADSADWLVSDSNIYLPSGTCEITPLVTWFKTDIFGRRYPIDNSYGKYRHVLAPATLGFEKAGKTGNLVYNNIVYKHPLAQEVRFRYAIPMPEHFDADSTPTSFVGSDPMATKDFSSPYLEARVKRGFLSIGKILQQTKKSPSSRLRKCFWAQLLNGSRPVGVICLNQSIDTNVPMGQSCELIAISSGREANGHDKGERSFLEYWEVEQRKKSNGVYKFYNVLWIEHHDGIAYRKALGRVKMQLWNRLELEEIDVTLG